MQAFAAVQSPPADLAQASKLARSRLFYQLDETELTKTLEFIGLAAPIATNGNAFIDGAGDLQG